MEIHFSSNKPRVEHRGIYVHKLPSDYVVLDLEATGFDWGYDEVIEVGILKFRDNKLVNQYQQLIKPFNRVDSFITELTGYQIRCWRINLD